MLKTWRVPRKGRSGNGGAGVRTHRGINTASVAGEGLQDLPGLLIAVFFVLAGTFLVRVWFGPADVGAIDTWLALAWFLFAPAAVVSFLISRRRDRELTARLEQELHRLNEGDGAARPTTDDAIEEHARTWKGELGLGEFRAEELHRAAQPRGVSPEGILTAVLVLFFVTATASILIPTTYESWMEIQSLVVTVSATVVAGALAGYVVHRVRRRLDDRRVVQESERRS